jgi:XTP/dITP diphosphohydrolase/ATP diphosphatase
MAAEAGYFDIHDVAANLNAKLIRRHPHIFGDETATDADAVLRNWEQIKLEEKKVSQANGAPKLASLLDEVPRAMPPLLEAGKLGSKAAKVGFDWPNVDGKAAELFEKLEEEIDELKAEVGAGSRELMEAELGDVLFTVVNLARHLKVDPDAALRGTNAKFRRRFKEMEAAAGLDGLRAKSAAELEKLWAEAKTEAAG